MHIKSRLALSAIGKQKDFDETLDVYPHKKIFKERQQSMLDQQLTSVRKYMNLFKTNSYI
jgi:hypothetical protein